MKTLRQGAKVAGVMGWPVGHSLSPRIHGYWLETHGIDGAYLPIPVPPESFEDALRWLPDMGFRGANVTVPHKLAALAAVDRADEAARRIGAVNTVTVGEDGSLAGSNTDAFGFIESLRAAVPGWRPEPAAVLGAGGAARAVVFALLEAGAPKVVVLNRTRARAEALAGDIGRAVEVRDWAARSAALGEAALLVNATVLGMTGQAPLEIDLAAMPAGGAVCDIVYAPLETPLLKAARARGLAAVDGLGMLLHQARPGFAAWFGVDPRVDEKLRRHVLAGAER